MDDISHHPNRLVEWAELIIPVEIKTSEFFLKNDQTYEEEHQKMA